MIDDIDYCETCQHCEIEPHLEPCVSCKTKYIGTPTKYLAKQRTNADRIRAMSDEELAENLCDKRLTKEMWLKWLKQPAQTHTENADRCVCCGEIIPEGRQVCPNCLAAVNERKDNG